MKRLRSTLPGIAMLLITFIAGAAVNISNSWDRLVNDPAFHYKDSKETLEKVSQSQDKGLLKLGTAILSFLNSPAGRFIGWVVFFIVLAWVLFKIFFAKGLPLFTKKNKELERENDVSDESLITTNWEQHLNVAIQEADARLAIRYSFMRLLQLLQINGFIHLKDNKTNTDYYNELNNAEIKRPFRQLSRQYEYTWYGHFEVADTAYRSYMATFNELKNMLKK